MENKYKKALEHIAYHFNDCDLTGDEASMWVLRTACKALNLKITYDCYNQVKLVKLGESQ